MDAITLLKNDHKSVEKLFKRYENAGDRAYDEKREIVDRIIEELSRHAAIEEQLFYPVARAMVPGVDDVVLESLEEHHIAKWVLSELETVSPEDERFDPKVTVLIENVRHHVEEEENEFFPMVRDELGRGALNELGDAMDEAKKVAPTHPHPQAPDSPPANVVVGAAAGVADRVSDTVSGLAQGGVSAVGDIIARVTQRKKPTAKPTGSKTARRTASVVRGKIDDTAEAVIETAEEQKRKATRTARQVTSRSKRTGSAAERAARSTTATARAGAKSTASSATRGAKQTATAAKRAAKSTTTSARRAAKSTATSARRGVKKTAAASKRSGHAA